MGGYLMALNMQYEKYFENSVLTSSREELTLLLYGGLVKFIMQAQLAIDGHDTEKAHNCIIKAKKILISFQNTLDMKYEVSKDLFMLYEYMYRRLTEANIKKDKEMLGEVLGFAKEMRDTWVQAMKLAKHTG